MRKRQLRLVQPNPKFDLDKFKTSPTPETKAKAVLRRRRLRLDEYFARIPYDRARALGRRNLTGTAWWLLIEIDRSIFEGRGKNPVRLTNRRTLGFSRFAWARALRQLVAAGVISVEQHPGRMPLVTSHWHPLSRRDLSG
jgi:hypothetical protein